MLSDRERIARQMANPALLRLHRALERLSSVVTVMNTGAHPDDETSGLLAALRFGYGMRVVIACSTRGEGGQNAIGVERGAALGVLRTREMEEAARVLDADVLWLGHGPADPVHDFGFSKNGEDSLARWGERRIVERLVRAYRSARPDIVIPTFLDVPGQHGHHRAMTRAAETAVLEAADPAASPEHMAEGLAPWRAAKFYLPAWSGGGGTYDDELPPPEASTWVRAPGRDAATGAAFGQIGEWSRSLHRSQGMGVWRDDQPASWPLHLKLPTRAENSEEPDIHAGLPATLAELAATEGLPATARSDLLQAQAEVDAARAAFPRRDEVLRSASRAATAVASALKGCPPPAHALIGHRLKRKLQELDCVMLEAKGVQVRAFARSNSVAPGGRVTVEVAIAADEPAGVTADLASRGDIHDVARSERDGVIRLDLAVAETAGFTNPYPPSFSALGGNGDVWVTTEADVEGRRVRQAMDLEEPLGVEPDCSMVLEPDAAILNLAGQERSFVVTALGGQRGAALDFEAPSGWVVTPPTDGAGSGYRIEAPTEVTPGVHELKPSLAGRPIHRIGSIEYAHIGRTAYVTAQSVRVLAVQAALPAGAQVGYVGGGSDRVGLWMTRLGLPVAELDAETLGGDLSRFTTIIIGIFGFGNRPDLAKNTGRLHRWVEAGGHLVTLYHRPTDGWDPDRTPPLRLEIGSPSLRWRVTDPAAPVSLLAPGHPLLTSPNRIGPQDWAGWDKERGLYFASRWDDRYQPLLALADPGERPLLGALVSAIVGRGRHTHTSLALHHQLDKLVPGAFRLIANLVQPA